MNSILFYQFEINFQMIYKNTFDIIIHSIFHIFRVCIHTFQFYSENHSLSTNQAFSIWFEPSVLISNCMLFQIFRKCSNENKMTGYRLYFSSFPDPRLYVLQIVSSSNSLLLRSSSLTRLINSENK